MTVSRYVEPKPVSRARVKNFVALDNLTAQVPLIELVQSSQTRRHVRIWTAYDYQRKLGTYTAIFPSGLVYTETIYPSGRKERKINKPADRRVKRGRR